MARKVLHEAVDGGGRLVDEPAKGRGDEPDGCGEDEEDLDLRALDLGGEPVDPWKAVGDVEDAGRSQAGAASCGGDPCVDDSHFNDPLVVTVS